MADTVTKEQRWVSWCAYEGTAFNGWQSQVDGQSVQDAIERRLEEIFRKPVRIHGAGRTDAGVHARAQVFHFDADWPHGPGKLWRALAVRLPEALLIRRVCHAPPDFHARFQARAKRYCYHWHEGVPVPWERHLVRATGHRRLDADAMQAAAECLLGTHDFSAFGANRRDGSTDNPVKTMYQMSVERIGRRRLCFTTLGSGYLFKMVRSIAGVLERVGEGRLQPDEVGEILASRARTEAVETAPAHGLMLDRVFYRGASRRAAPWKACAAAGPLAS